jgi:hemerythrin
MGHDGLSPNRMSGVRAMEASHRVLLVEMERAAIVPDAEFADCYAALVASVEHDFASEEQAMEEIDFSGLKIHREQHAKILGGPHHAASKVRGGDIAAGRVAIELLPKWFEFHICTMDAALAVALQIASLPPGVTDPAVS